jgi:hypothetical protein
MFTNWKLLVAGAALLVGTASLGYCFKPASVSFRDLDDARTVLESHGFYCIADADDQVSNTGFMVSHESATVDEARGLCKVGKMGAAWKGRVWVTLNPAHFRLETVPDLAGVRMWGDIVAFGDEDLLREIDAALPRRSAP